MDSAFFHIEIGLAVALIAVYLLMAVNFQSWGDPFVVLLGASAGVLRHRREPVHHADHLLDPLAVRRDHERRRRQRQLDPAGAFAREERERSGCSAREAAIEAGETRLRPVLMTAGAMFVGLLPMAIGLGEGAEQNAALARAVLGGVAVGTCSTLLFVPFLYSLLRRAHSGRRGTTCER